MSGTVSAKSHLDGLNTSPQVDGLPTGGPRREDQPHMDPLVNEAQ